MPVLTEPRRLAWDSTAYSRGEHRAVGLGDEVAQDRDQVLGRGLADLLGLAFQVRRERLGAALGQAHLLDVLLAHAGAPVEPVPSCGAAPAIVAAAITRSPRSAAQASVCGPPPDQPTVWKRSIPRASAMASTSAAQSATDRPS